MCGIAGIINFDKNNGVDPVELKLMTDAIVSRGPDDEGFYLAGNIGFGFRRLSIIDLHSGKQPISNEDGSVWVIMNGEIYNYKEIKSDLLSRGHTFKTNSDTEVLVHLYEEFGEGFVKKLRGMFAFALHDTVQSKVILGRDRLGIKPLFYYSDAASMVFGSEIKEIKKVRKALELNNEGILDYFTYGYTLEEKTCYKNIKKLPPAHCLVLDLNTGNKKIERYWQLEYKPEAQRTEDEWIEIINEKLKETVKCHMISDVPLGAFLSGGVDSSAVVAAMASLSAIPIKTFSIGFKEEKYNELKYAKIVSGKFNTEHQELILEPGSIDIINDIVDLYDEPYADSSAIPTYFLSKMTRQHVTVALSGDGGDEIFAGYKSYRKADYIHRKLKYNPPIMRGLIGLGLKMYPDHFYGKGLLYYLSKQSKYLACYNGIFKEYELSNLLNKDFTCSLNNYSSFDSKIKMLNSYKSGDFVTDCELLDVHAYMVDDILTKVDRASMANSLEVRVPLLDHELVEMAFKIPSKFKLKEGEGKYIFKKSLERELPHEILYRKKQGFALPLSKWFKNDLDNYVKSQLLDKNNLIYNFIDAGAVKNVIAVHAKGQRDFSAQIWTILFFSEWLKKNS
ncbi:MAG: asparagine synthase (glutamine-hydrolyzing) [Bacteroidota bacterium]